MPSFNIPAGPKNLLGLFPSLNFSDIEEYYVEVKNNAGVTVATTTRYKLGGCCDEDKVRLFFLNKYGGIDSINCLWITESADLKSDKFQRSQSVPLSITEGGLYRNNVKSERTRTLIIKDYPTTANEWILEAFDSPTAWIEDRTGNMYLPVVIVDKKVPVKKDVDPFDNIFEIEIQLANQTVRQRN